MVYAIRNYLGEPLRSLTLARVGLFAPSPAPHFMRSRVVPLLSLSQRTGEARAGIGGSAASSSKYARIKYLLLATIARSAILDTIARRRRVCERDSSGTTVARRPQVREAHAVETSAKVMERIARRERAEAHLWCAWRAKRLAQIKNSGFGANTENISDFCPH
jgi:hypothetical protein